MAATDASAYPIKNTAWRVTFPILDADGDLVTGAATLDSEISKDGGTFADCTNEATEIATSSGVYYLDLTSTEMNADTVAIIVKTGTAGAKTTTIVAYPITTSTAKLGVNLVNIAGSAVSTSTAQLGVNVVNAAGTAWGSGAITSGAFATGAITATAIAADAIGASELAADAASEIGTAVWATATRVLTANTNLNDPTAAAIADAVWDEARSGHVAAGSFGEGVASVQGNVTGSVDSVTGAVGSVTGAVGSVTGAVGSVTGNVGGNVTGSVGSLAAQAKADVNAEVVDALNTDTYAEPGQGAPAATATLAAKVNYLYKAWRNKKEQTSTTWSLYDDAGTTVDQKSTVSDDGTTATRGEVATGA